MNRQFRIVFSALFLFLFNVSIAQQDSVFIILEYGYPPSNDYRNAKSTVGDKWGIEFKSVGGCVVSRELVDSVRIHNEKTGNEIAKKYGSDWSNRFYQEVDQEYQKQLIVREIIDNQKFIKQLDSILKTESNQVYYFLYRTSVETIYTAIVFGFGDWNGYRKMIIYYRITIDIKKKSVIIDSDKKELL